MRFIFGWKLNIAALRCMWNDVKKEGEEIESLATRRLNQDCLEIFFAQVRQGGGQNKNPTPFQFMCIFKKLFAQNCMEHAEGSNCIEDFDKILIHLANGSNGSGSTPNYKE